MVNISPTPSGTRETHAPWLTASTVRAWKSLTCRPSDARLMCPARTSVDRQSLSADPCPCAACRRRCDPPASYSLEFSPHVLVEPVRPLLMRTTGAVQQARIPHRLIRLPHGDGAAHQMKQIRHAILLMRSHVGGIECGKSVS